MGVGERMRESEDDEDEEEEEEEVMDGLSLSFSSDTDVTHKSMSRRPFAVFSFLLSAEMNGMRCGGCGFRIVFCGCF